MNEAMMNWEALIAFGCMAVFVFALIGYAIDTHERRYH